MRVQLVSSRRYSDYILRRFTLTKKSNIVGGSKGNQQNRQSTENEICREIVQFQFLKFNEYLNSDEQPSWLLCFIGKINEYVFDNNSNSQISSGPLLLHCEDGCSRSGVFAAVRSLMSLIQFNKYQDNLNNLSEQQLKTIETSSSK